MSGVRASARNAALRARRYVLRLTGQQAALDALNRQQAELDARAGVLHSIQVRLDAIETDLARRVDAVHHHLQSLESELAHRSDVHKAIRSDVAPLLAAEIDRLDSYLVYHADKSTALLEELAVGTRGGGAHAVLTVGPDLDAIFSSAGFDFVVPTREEGLLVFLTHHGIETTEPGVRAVITADLRPGDVAVDVGASIGMHSVVMAAGVGPSGRVLCFEPLPHMAAAVERTMRLNGFRARAEVRVAGLADRSGTARLFAAEHSPMSSLFPLDAGTAGEPLEIPVTTLDEAVPPGGRVDLVKIDVEGAEPLVWKGMQRVRADNPRLTIVLEWAASHFARSGHDPVAFMDDILDDGFSVAVIKDEPVGRLDALTREQATRLEAGNVLLRRGR